MAAKYFANFALMMDEFSLPGISIENPRDTFNISGQVLITHIPNKNWKLLKEQCMYHFVTIGDCATGFAKVEGMVIVKITLD